MQRYLFEPREPRQVEQLVIGHERLFEAEKFEILESDVLELCHVGAGETESSQVLHSVKMAEARGGDLRIIKVEVLELLKPGQMLKPGVGDLGLLELKAVDFPQRREVPQVFDGDVRIVQVDQREVVFVAQELSHDLRRK